MKPGKLNKRISIYDFTADVEYDDDGGGWIDNLDEEHGWTHILDTWASIRPASEKAQAFAGQMMSVSTHTLLVRYNPLIKQSHVIKYDNRRFDIETIRNFDESDTYLQLMCIEKVQE